MSETAVVDASDQRTTFVNQDGLDVQTLQLEGLSPAELSQELLERVRREQPVEGHLRAIAQLDEPDLDLVRTDPDRGRSFWLNIYNAAVQILLDSRPDLFDSKLQFFRAEAITVSDVSLRLDDIEHGILRNGRAKYGLGYLPRLARSGLGSSYRVELDPRIHFALNCGAASCPAILAYDPATIDGSLDAATESYLRQSVEYTGDRDKVRIPRIFLWFIGDFGGFSGIRDLLREYDLVPKDSSPSIRFKSYDWSKSPRQFATPSHEGS